MGSGDVSVDLPTVAVHASPAAAERAADAGTSEKAMAVEFHKEQQWRIGLKTKLPKPQSIAESLVVPGKVVAPYGAEALIVPPGFGRVTPPAPAAFPRVGDRVSEGQPVARRSGSA